MFLIWYDLVYRVVFISNDSVLLVFLRPFCFFSNIWTNLLDLSSDIENISRSVMSKKYLNRNGDGGVGIVVDSLGIVMF